jgi:hypothetical protein
MGETVRTNLIGVIVIQADLAQGGLTQTITPANDDTNAIVKQDGNTFTIEKVFVNLCKERKINKEKKVYKKRE